MSNDSATSPNRSKRTRIDPTARPIETEQANAGQKAPKALALAFVKSHTASLQPKVAEILEKLGTQHINLLSKKFQKTTQIEKMETNAEFIPRSARILFELHMTEAATATTEFQTLQTTTNEKVNEFRLFLKQQIIAATKIEAKIIHQQIQDDFITSLRHIVTAFLTANSIPTTTESIKTIIRTIISDQDIFKHSGLTTESFILRASQMMDDTTTTTPSPMDHSDSLVMQGHTPYQPRPITREALPPSNLSTELHAVAQTTKQAFKSVFVTAWDQYIDQIKKNKINHELSKLHVAVFDEPATQKAADIVSNEPSADPKTLKNIIVAQTKAETKKLLQEIKKLNDRVESLQKNTPTRSRGHSSSPNQPATTRNQKQRQSHRSPCQRRNTNRPQQQNRTSPNKSASSSSHSTNRRRNQRKQKNEADESNNASKRNNNASNNNNSNRRSNRRRSSSTTQSNNRSTSSNRK